MDFSRGNAALEAFAAELVRRGRSPQTVKGYLKDLKDFIRFLEAEGLPFDPGAVLPEDLAAYRRALSGRVRPATANRRLAALKAFFDWAAGAGLVRENPAGRLAGFKDAARDRAPRALSTPELRRLLREARRAANPLHRAVVVVLLNTGLRASELCGLKLSDLELSERRGRLHVRGKGEKARTVPLNAEVREALREWLAVRPAAPDDRLFIGRRGPLTPDGVWYIVRKLARRAGLEDVHPHALRHTFATRLLREAGADLPTVAELLGHESIDTTARYTRPSEKDLQAAVDRLG